MGSCARHTASSDAENGPQYMSSIQDLSRKSLLMLAARVYCACKYRVHGNLPIRPASQRLFERVLWVHRLSNPQRPENCM